MRSGRTGPEILELFPESGSLIRLTVREPFPAEDQMRADRWEGVRSWETGRDQETGDRYLFSTLLNRYLCPLFSPLYSLTESWRSSWSKSSNREALTLRNPDLVEGERTWQGGSSSSQLDSWRP